MLLSSRHLCLLFSATLSRRDIDWSRFAYVQYATNTAYLCNSVMMFERLHQLQSQPDRVLMYPSCLDPEMDSIEGELLRKMQAHYRARLVPIDVQSRISSDVTWAESSTKLLAFNQTQYARVLSLDSDGTILQAMDELFLLPPAPVAMPRAYWLGFEHRLLTSAERIQGAGQSDYDMEILNDLYKDRAMVLPHRPYILLTGEFRARLHTNYLGGHPHTSWNPDLVLSEAKFRHFSDWPVSKPWLKTPDTVMDQEQPACNNATQTGRPDCRSRELWLGFYQDFAQRRQRLCRLNVH
ncbi:nucleotide-diphospho-sugar transferase [Aspergillus uvarum CBS 121591]|uniref:Nucleotide-diphospho-sugar transferase n=1 Tax=Aspergillus uvarum CBS 121591 TaxID=1448315 RepID=A0A319CM79_9EURO|nr:nucleotide-diphospho-sugar transferase [Aspergillus uvarum CBS 121591]PYH84187.1 nucleotide-diphospho-sugar transferase [Aspergillus uvarum CBS 121591]